MPNCPGTGTDPERHCAREYGHNTHMACWPEGFYLSWIRPTIVLAAVAALAVGLFWPRPVATAVTPPSSTPFLSEVLVAETLPGGAYVQISADWFVPSLGGHKVTFHYNSDPLGPGVGWERSFLIGVMGPFPQDNPIPAEFIVDPFNFAPVEQAPFDNDEVYNWYTIRAAAALEAELYLLNLLEAKVAEFPPSSCLSLFETEDNRWFRLFDENDFKQPAPGPIVPCQVLDGSCPDVVNPYVKTTPISCSLWTTMTLSSMLAPPAPAQIQNPYTPLYTYPNTNPWSIVPPVPAGQLPGYFFLPSPQDLHPSYYMPNYFFPNYNGVPIRP